METTAITAVVKVGTHVYFVGSAACIGALQRFGSLVLVSVRNALARAALRISVELTDWHDCPRMLEEGGQCLCFGYAWQWRKDAFARSVVVRGRPVLNQADSCQGRKCFRL